MKDGTVLNVQVHVSSHATRDDVSIIIFNKKATAFHSRHELGAAAATCKSRDVIHGLARLDNQHVMGANPPKDRCK